MIGCVFVSQFRRFQEQTLSRLDLLNHVSNVSTPLEVRVQTLSDQHRNLTQELTQLRYTTTQVTVYIILVILLLL
jgi:hypothetical protein